MVSSGRRRGGLESNNKESYKGLAEEKKNEKEEPERQEESIWC